MIPLFQRASTYPEALGWEEVPAAADQYNFQTVEDRTDRSTARSVRPMEVGPCLLTV